MAVFYGGGKSAFKVRCKQQSVDLWRECARHTAGRQQRRTGSTTNHVACMDIGRASSQRSAALVQSIGCVLAACAVGRTVQLIPGVRPSHFATHRPAPTNNQRAWSAPKASPLCSYSPPAWLSHMWIVSLLLCFFQKHADLYMTCSAWHFFFYYLANQSVSTQKCYCASVLLWRVRLPHQPCLFFLSVFQTTANLISTPITTRSCPMDAQDEAWLQSNRSVLLGAHYRPEELLSWLIQCSLGRSQPTRRTALLSHPGRHLWHEWRWLPRYHGPRHSSRTTSKTAGHSAVKEGSTPSLSSITRWVHFVHTSAITDVWTKCTHRALHATQIA